LSRSIALLFLALIVAGQVRAQSAADEENEPVWYQVEVIVFRYLETEGESEDWPALPALAYPLEAHHLRPGATENNLRQQFALLQIEDTLTKPAFDLAWDKSVDQLLRDYALMLEERRGSAQLNETDVLDASALDAPEAIADPLDATVPNAFVTLDESSSEFKAQIGSIRRSRDMRLLLHRTWLQPFRAREQSLPVLLDGDITGGDYPALQGSLLLYVSRYLHVETNLWLNTEESTNDHSPAEWRMPAPPLPPQPYTRIPWAFQVELETGFSDELSLATAISQETGPAEILQPVVIDARRISSEEIPPVDMEEFLQQPDYPFGQAVLLQQRRRMRSSELHYLDHPLLGVILRVSPYEFEPFFEPEEISGEIAGSAPGSRQ
jgi:hypothetical protein